MKICAINAFNLLWHSECVFDHHFFCRAFKNFEVFSGLHCMKLFSANGCISNLPMTHLGGTSFFPIKSGVITKAAFLSGEGDLRSHPSGTNAAARSTLLGDLSFGIEMHSDAIAFVTLA